MIAAARMPGFLGKLVRLFSRREKALVVLLLLGMLVGAVLEAAGIGLVMPFLVVLSDPRAVENHASLAWIYQLSGAGSRRQFVVWLGVSLLIAYVLKSSFLGVLAYAKYRFIFNRQSSIGSRVLAVHMRRPYAYHLRTNSALLVRKISSDVNRVVSNVLVPAAYVAVESMIACAIVALLFALRPVPTLFLVVGLGGAAGIFYAAIRDRLLFWGKRSQAANGKMLQSVQEALGALKETKVLGRDEFFINQFSRRASEYARAARAFRTTSDFPRLFLELLAASGMILLGLAYAGRGEVAWVVPTLGLFAVAAIRLLPSLNRIVASITSIHHDSSALDDVYQDVISAADVRRDHQPERPRQEVFRETIELCDVSCVYDGASRPALDRVSLTIRRAQSVGIVGASGAGKTTLVDVILGLLSPTTGEVRIDGQPLGAILPDWQRSIGYVPQQVFLTDDTIRRNVALARDEKEIDERRIAGAVAAARLDDLVASLPNKLETVVGERGVRLSGGQRQRIGIARALYDNPSVLIMDEATSALDNRTEAEIKEAITDVSREKTVLIIAHRLTTIKSCDVLFFLKEGRLLEVAPFEALLSSNEEFRTLIRSGRVIADV